MKALILMMLILSTNLFAGEKGNGGFPDSARAMLKLASTELSFKLSTELKDIKLQHLLSNAPKNRGNIAISEVSVKWMANVIAHVRQMTNEELIEDTQSMGRFLSTDDENLSIRAEKAFYYHYGQGGDAAAPKEHMQEIKRKLLHEVSHLWGYDEVQARAFSEACLNFLYRNTDQTWTPRNTAYFLTFAYLYSMEGHFEPSFDQARFLDMSLMMKRFWINKKQIANMIITNASVEGTRSSIGGGCIFEEEYRLTLSATSEERSARDRKVFNRLVQALDSSETLHDFAIIVDEIYNCKDNQVQPGFVFKRK